MVIGTALGPATTACRALECHSIEYNQVGYIHYELVLEAEMAG
jgi:hypothetical protein